jgi:predicted TIM-barrel fold metal-dependent hydrolase
MTRRRFGVAVGSGARVRSRLDHPVVDADGHWIEPNPVFFEFIREIAGAEALAQFRAGFAERARPWYRASPEERRRRRMTRPPFWGMPANTADRAAAMIPALFRERLDDWGIDVAIVYPSIGLGLSREVRDPDLRGGIFRAYNTMVAELFRPYADRLIAVGVVSLNEPEEAIVQLEEAHALGLRLVVTGGSVPRPIEEDADGQPDPRKRRVYIDGLGLDSPHEYDPVWEKFVALKMPVATHSGSMGWPDRSSPSNFVANHLGHFAQSHHLFARSLFLGGVTERFPALNFAFLEGGVGWACGLYADLMGHWEKRNRTYMAERLKPTNLDRGELRRLFERYTAGDRRFEGTLDDLLDRNLDGIDCDITPEELAERDLDADDFAKVRIGGRDDIRRLFAGNFYFGCEADDPMTAVAFNEKMGLRLKPVLGSDISHFDVAEAAEVLGEAWELVERGLIDEEDFRAFTFSNVVQLCGGMNPDFFEGTIIAEAARRELDLARARKETR